MMLVGQIGAVVVIAVILGVAGVPMFPVVLAAAAIGGGLVARHMATQRAEGAAALAPGTIDQYAVSMSAERVAVGRAVQVRLLPPTRAVWAPGVLALDDGVVAFVPSKARLSDRAWSGDVERVQLLAVGPRASAVRIYGPDGSAQFVTQMPVDQLRSVIEPYLVIDH